MTATCCQLVICCRYEKTAFQKEVQQRFDALQDSYWTVLDASKSIEDLQVEVSVCQDGDCNRFMARLCTLDAMLTLMLATMS